MPTAALPLQLLRGVAVLGVQELERRRRARALRVRSLAPRIHGAADGNTYATIQIDKIDDLMKINNIQ